MANINTKIEWTDATWSPVTGCTKVSQGCKNCYAERVMQRFSPEREFTDVRCHPERLDAPLHWKKPRRVFVNSMSDLFHEDVSDNFIDEVFAVMGSANWHTYQVLTKRPQRMLEWFSERWQPAPETAQRALYNDMVALGEQLGTGELAPFVLDTEGEGRFEQVYEALDRVPACVDTSKSYLWSDDGTSNLMAGDWPLPNVWLGVSVEDQTTADERIPLLLQTPAAVRFISAEPLLGPVSLRWLAAFDGQALKPRGQGVKTDELDGLRRLDWVIAGGESGPNARPSELGWYRSLRDQCAAAGVSFFMKQITERGRKIPYESFPMDLQIRKYPDA